MRHPQNLKALTGVAWRVHHPPEAITDSHEPIPLDHGPPLETKDEAATPKSRPRKRECHPPYEETRGLVRFLGACGGGSYASISVVFRILYGTP